MSAGASSIKPMSASAAFHTRGIVGIDPGDNGDHDLNLGVFIEVDGFPRLEHAVFVDRFDGHPRAIGF